MNTKEILTRIDLVIGQNKRHEWLFIGLSAVLFLTGIACFIVALVAKEFYWSTPAAITTGCLYWPLKQINRIRQKNISLATAPILIDQLPPEKAAEEIQKLLQNLYKDEK